MLKVLESSILLTPEVILERIEEKVEIGRSLAQMLNSNKNKLNLRRQMLLSLLSKVYHHPSDEDMLHHIEIIWIMNNSVERCQYVRLVSCFLSGSRSTSRKSKGEDLSRIFILQISSFSCNTAVKGLSPQQFLSLFLSCESSFPELLSGC